MSTTQKPLEFQPNRSSKGCFATPLLFLNVTFHTLMPDQNTNLQGYNLAEQNSKIVLDFLAHLHVK